MSAFILHKRSFVFSIDDVDSLYLKKELSLHESLNFGDFHLRVYSTETKTRASFTSGNDWIRAFGTFIYKGLSSADGLKQALLDAKKNQLSHKNFCGNFALLLWIDQKLTILTDALGVYQLFANEDCSCISSSFLAVIAASPHKRRINRKALYEKLLTGYIVGPDTLVEGIQHLTPARQRELHSADFTFVTSPQYTGDSSCPAKFGDAVDLHDQNLQTYFDEISPFVSGQQIDMGLSSGYDSRLIALYARHLPADFSVHTHHVQGVHDGERKRSEAIAKALGLPIRVYPQQALEKMEVDAVEMALLDGLYYYDARSGDNSGAYSPTYTRAYKQESLGGANLRFNGEGGEIFRNYYHTALPRVHFPSWMKDHLYYSVFSHALPDRDLQEEITEYILKKLSRALGRDLTGTVDLECTRVYYGEVRIPQCEGVLANADSQIANFLMPFAEADIQRSAYGLTSHVGVSGRFQSAMIQKLDARIASLPSHHGFPLSSETFMHKVKSAVRGYVPPRVWLQRMNRYYANPNSGAACAEGYRNLSAQSTLLQEAEAALSTAAPDFDFDQALRESPCKATAVFMGLFLREFSDMIDFS